jgi:uncharacterized protein
MSRASLRGRLGTLEVAAVAALALQALTLVAVAEEPHLPLDLATFPRTSLEITHLDERRVPHKYPFTVWVADTPQRSEQGLMFVSDLPETQGMVFPLKPPRVEAMWMKNTYIELDMLFIRADGRVAKIIAHAAPMSLKSLSSDTPVAAVLELRGGEVAKLGLRVGDTVSWKTPPP